MDRVRECAGESSRGVGGGRGGSSFPCNKIWFLFKFLPLFLGPPYPPHHRLSYRYPIVPVSYRTRTRGEGAALPMGLGLREGLQKMWRPLSQARLLQNVCRVAISTLSILRNLGFIDCGNRWPTNTTETGQVQLNSTHQTSWALFGLSGGPGRLDLALNQTRTHPGMRFTFVCLLYWHFDIRQGESCSPTLTPYALLKKKRRRHGRHIPLSHV